MAKNREYDYGFHDDVNPTYSTGKGMTEEIVRNISKVKNEPDWMLEYRLKSLELFHKLPMPDWGPDLSGGCTAPNYTTNSLHAATVEIIVKRDASFRYTTIQNWSDNVYNLVTERGTVEENGMLEWIDGNLGSKVNMKYPCSILNGPHARTSVLSMAFANYGQHLDAGCKVYHNAPHTSSTLISKSVAKDGGKTDYRGSVYFGKNSGGSKSHIECDTILMDDLSSSDTIPFNEIHNSNVALEHEAKVSKVSEDQLYYMMSRGISEEEATAMIVNGFMEPITKELPMEYAVE